MSYARAEIQQRFEFLSAMRGGVLLEHALPGGCGTLDELFEAITWGQLGLHDKPIGLCDVAGYFASLLRFLEDATTAGFIGRTTLELLIVRERPDELLSALFV